jgi:hypothetical protein
VVDAGSILKANTIRLEFLEGLIPPAEAGGPPGPCLDQNGETPSDCVRTFNSGNGKNEVGMSSHFTLQIKAFAIDCEQMTTSEIKTTY